MKDETGPEFRKLKARYEAIRAAGGDMHFTLGDAPGSLEEVAAVANAMLDYVPSKSSADADGWERHGGGEQPLTDSTILDIEFDNGEIARATRADAWEWDHALSEPSIIRYRLHDRA